MKNSKQVSYTGKEIFVGIDVHKKNYSIVARVDKVVVKKWTTAASPKALAQQLQKYFSGALPHPAILSEFFPSDSLQLEISASRSVSAEVEIVAGERITHLAEFRMMPSNQPEMVKRTTSELDRAMKDTAGLISATFHRSLDGTRMFNYGQWENKEAFEAILQQPGFNPDKPYWEGLARNEFHLYTVVHVEEIAA